MTLGDIPSSNERPVSRRRFICRQKAELWVGWACLAAWLAGWMHLFQRHGNGMSSFHACRPFSQEECVEFFWGPEFFPSSSFRSEEGGSGSYNKPTELRD